MAGSLYYGDNLGVLRAHVRDETIDLVYLDPQFKANASYNIASRADQTWSKLSGRAIQEQRDCDPRQCQRESL